MPEHPILKHTSEDDFNFANRIPIESIGPPPKIPQVNDVIQATGGDHIGRLGIIGRIDPDKYKCYVITAGGGKDYFDVLPGEFALIGRAKKAIKDPISETPNINADTSPFGGMKL